LIKSKSKLSSINYPHDKKLMLTRSKCMAASEAAGEKNWDMEMDRDTFHPPTTVVAAPDPILAQSEPPPNPTHSYRVDKNSKSPPSYQ